jgi:lipopolysaccharide biosynthesis protein
MAPVPVGYKLLEVSDYIKRGYIVLCSFSDWKSGQDMWIGNLWGNHLLPMANPIDDVVRPKKDNLLNIVKSAIEIFATNINWNRVPDFKLHELKEKTGLDLDTLVKIRDIVQER